MTAPKPQGTRRDGLDLLRVFASVLVVFSHIAAWFSIARQDWWLTHAVEAGVGTPLRLNPHLAFVGVGTFFMITGVVVTGVVSRENPGQFLYRRLTRLIPLLWVVTLLAWIMINLGQRITARTDPALDAVELLRGLVLGNFFTVPQIAFVGVTWTLLIQTLFYVYVAAAIPLLRRVPWIAPAAAAALCFVVILFSTVARNSVGEDLRIWTHHAGIWATYIPLMCIGQIIALAHSGKLNRYAAVALGIVHYLLFVWSDRVGGFTFQGDSMPRTALLVTLLLLLLMRVSGPVSKSRLIKAWSARTYAIYLVHLGCLYPVMDALVPRLGPELAVLTGLATLAAVSEILHRFVEMPADRWLRGRRVRSTAPQVSAGRPDQPSPVADLTEDHQMSSKGANSRPVG